MSSPPALRDLPTNAQAASATRKSPRRAGFAEDVVAPTSASRKSPRAKSPSAGKKSAARRSSIKTMEKPVVRCGERPAGPPPLVFLAPQALVLTRVLPLPVNYCPPLQVSTEQDDEEKRCVQFRESGVLRVLL